MDTKSLKQYIELCVKGDSTIGERYKIISATKAKTQKQINSLKEQLSLLDYKENFYKNIIDNNLEDSWNPMNKIEST